jgi:hypothetical protein
MAQNAVEVVDKEGWRRVYPLQKAIVHIGAGPGNDIVLDSARGGGVAARHIQLIARAGGGQGYRLVNMGDTDILLGASGDRRITPRSFIDLGDGEQVRLGDFTLVFAGGMFAGGASLGPALGSASTGAGGNPVTATGASGGIGLSLSMPRVQLAPHQSLDGSIMVRNMGDKAGAQFKLEIEGLEPDWFEIGPGPILFPGAAKEVSLRLFHPGRPAPAAGDYRFVVRATAPSAYPGESATAVQVIQILPFYSHTLRVIPPA